MIGLLGGIVEWEDIIEMTETYAIVDKPTFLKDFGPWKKGYKTDMIQIASDENTLETEMQEYDEERVLVATVKVHLEVSNV